MLNHLILCPLSEKNGHSNFLLFFFYSWQNWQFKSLNLILIIIDYKKQLLHLMHLRFYCVLSIFVLK